MGNMPFLFGYATSRTEVPSIEGYYNSIQCMWINTLTDLPAIERPDNSELFTKTKVNNEQDDDGVFSLELATKTHVQVEQDDSNIEHSFFSELLTKTDVVQESDDNCVNGEFLGFFDDSINHE